MSKSFVIGAAGALALAAGLASANIPKTFTNSQGGRIPDFVGTTPGLLRQEIVIPPDNDGPIKRVDFSVTLPSTAGGTSGGHTWVGDLIIKLTHKDTGRSVIIVNRPGVGAGSTVGDNSDMLGTYNFSDTFTADFAAAALATTAPVPQGNYHPFGNLNDFTADGFKFGTWSLEITDNAGGDTGGILSWSITVYNQVPTPGAAALFGLAGLAGIRRRR